MVNDLPEAIIEAGIDLTLRNVKGEKMTPKEIALATSPEALSAPVVIPPGPAEITYEGKTVKGWILEERNPHLKNQPCQVCNRKILMLAYQGTGVCCVLCDKVRSGELTPEQADLIWG